MRKKQNKPLKNRHKRAYKKYSAETMLLAYEAVKEKKLSVHMAAKAFSVPVQTLRDRVKGYIDPHNVHLGSESVLIKDEEMALLEHIENMAEMGYHTTHVQIQRLAGDIAHSSGKRITSKGLSNSWLYSFLCRWKSRISAIKPKAVKAKRGMSSTPETVDCYYQNLKKVLEKYDLHDKPHYIYHIHETRIVPEEKRFVFRNRKSLISPTAYASSIISCVNAAGSAMPPYFVFEGKRYKSDLIKGATPGTKGVVSDTGFSNCQIFREYLEDHFLPLARQGSSSQHILLVFDGNISQISTPLIAWARSKNLILFPLPAYTSHYLGPLPAGVINHMKRYYYEECDDYNGQAITKNEVCELVCNAYMKAFTRANIKSGFRKTGLYPYSDQNVNREKLFTKEWFRYQDSTESRQTKKRKSRAKNLKVHRAQLKVSDMESQSTSGLRIVFKEDVSGDTDGEMDESEDDDNDGVNQDDEEEQETDDSNDERESDDNEDGDEDENDIEHEGDIYEDEDADNNDIEVKEEVIYEVQEEDIYEDDEDDIDYEESDICCVCKKFSPPNINDRPYLKIVTWARCDKCPHWVHLGFCIKQTVLRREDRFLCLHCQQ